MRDATLIGLFDELEKLGEISSPESLAAAQNRVSASRTGASAAPPSPPSGISSVSKPSLGMPTGASSAVPAGTGPAKGMSPPPLSAAPAPKNLLSSQGGRVGQDPTSMGKMGGIKAYIARKILGQPAVLYGRHESLKKGRRRHRETMRALDEGYPAGWVPLGMRPRR